MSHPYLETRAITKRYGDVAANDSVDFSVRAGEIHALLGENGAGKTTLMRILSGFVQPDSGTILLDGQPIRLQSPSHAMSLGIGMVHQHWRLVEKFTVADNLRLGNPFRGSNLDFKRQIEDISRHFGLKVRPDAYVWELSLGERQRLEILRVLQRGARTLILDEPTAVLSPQECVQLFDAVRQMAAEGNSIVLISHKMQDVMQWCDRITVLRRGRVVAERSPRDVTAAELAELTVGRAVHVASPARRSQPGDYALELEGVFVSGGGNMATLKDISFKIREGEILGVAGVSGNGQTELAEVCAGLVRPSRGRITLRGRDIKGLGAAAVNRAGLAYVPDDRVGTGICPNLGIDENLILRDPGRKAFTRWGLLDRRAILQWARQKSHDFDIVLPDLSGPIRRLSGGNMQKVVLARELSGDVKVLVAAQPIRGLDVAASEAVHTMMLDARDRGGAILLISDDLDEIAKLSDRIIVMHRGEIMAEMSPDASREKIGLAMTGVRQSADRAPGAVPP